MAQAIELGVSVGAPEDNSDGIEERVTTEKESSLGSNRHSISVKSM